MMIKNGISYDRVIRLTDDMGNPAGLNAIIDGLIISVPLDPNNRHYAEIMRQVEAGELTIQEATN